MSRRGRLTALLCWLPVAGVVVALFAAPSSTGGSVAAGSLTVSPNNTYGGQEVTFSGDMGSGRQVIRMQRRGSTSAPWADVIDPRDGRVFKIETDADGSFRFAFPALAMNGAYVRMVNGNGVGTEAHLTKTVHQDADLAIVETDAADVPLPRGYTVKGEDFFISVDTVGKASLKKPVLNGRGVTLQVRRESDDAWVSVDTGIVDSDGKIQLGRYGTGIGDTPRAAGVYRVRLENWTKNGDEVGWFPSLPFYLYSVNRPDPVTGLAAPDPTTSSIKLTWDLPADTPGRIVIARSSGGTAKAPRDVIADIPGSDQSYTDSGLPSGYTYGYAVYTVDKFRAADRSGVYTRVPTRIIASTDPSARGEG